VRAEKPLESDILNRFFRQIGADDSLPPAVVEALLELRKEGLLTNTDKVSAAIRDGANVKS
jgi:hypothetical protein